MNRPKFFLGIPYPTMVIKVEWKQYFLSFNRISDDRKSNFAISDWVADSGAFTLLSKHGKFPFTPEQHAAKINRWSKCGNLLAAVCADWLCSPLVLEKTGLSVTRHQELTVANYLVLRNLTSTYIMPSLQGATVEDYQNHLALYGDSLAPDQWVGVGSLVGLPAGKIAAILKAIKADRPDLNLHAFGCDCLEDIAGLAYSADAMKYRASRHHQRISEPEAAREYLKRLKRHTSDYAPYRKTSTSGAGNGQGRKPQWAVGKTVPIRVPEKFATRLLEIARDWDRSGLEK